MRRGSSFFSGSTLVPGCAFTTKMNQNWYNKIKSSTALYLNLHTCSLSFNSEMIRKSHSCFIHQVLTCTCNVREVGGPTLTKLVTLLVRARTSTASVQILQDGLVLMQKATKDSSMDLREECLCLSGRRPPCCACFLVETVTQVKRWQLWCSSPSSWHPVTESQQQ